MTYEAEVLADSPTIYWRYGDSSGTTAVDDSGNGHNGTYSGSPTLGVTGLVHGDSDTAVEFATGQSCASAHTFGTYDLSSGMAIEAVFKIVTQPTSTFYLGEISGNILWLSASGGGTKIQANTDNGTNGFSNGFGPSTTVGHIYHAVCRFNPGNGNVELYVNGVLHSGQAMTGSPHIAASSFLRTFFVSGTGDVIVDELAYYESDLSASRIAAHFAALVQPQALSVTETQTPTLSAHESFGKTLSVTETQTPTVTPHLTSYHQELDATETQTPSIAHPTSHTTSKNLSVTQTQTSDLTATEVPHAAYESAVLTDTPLIYYRLGESSGTVAVDDSGNGWDGAYSDTGSGDYTLGEPGLLASDPNTAVFFDNSNTLNVHVESTVWPPIDTVLTEFSVEIWANIADARNAWGYSFIAGIYENTADIEVATLSSGADNYLGYWLSTDTTSHNGYLTLLFTENTTYYLVLTYDGADVKFYVNAVEEASFSITGTVTIPAGENFRVGCDGFGVGDGVNGTLDEAAFYDYALSAAQITAHYSAGTSGPPTSQHLDATQTQTPSASHTNGKAKAVTVTQVQTPTITAAFGSPFPLYAFKIGNTLFSPSDGILIARDGVDGLGVPDAKTQDVQLVHADGVYANPDYTVMRVITIPIIIRGANTATVLDSLTTLETACAPVTSDITLIIRLPGFGFVTATGRPRSLHADLTHARHGAITALFRFDCPDPELVFS